MPVASKLINRLLHLQQVDAIPQHQATRLTDKTTDIIAEIEDILSSRSIDWERSDTILQKCSVWEQVGLVNDPQDGIDYWPQGCFECTARRVKCVPGVGGSDNLSKACQPCRNASRSCGSQYKRP